MARTRLPCYSSLRPGRFVSTYPGVVPHQALPGVFEARLAEVSTDRGPAPGSYKYLGVFPTQEAAHAALVTAGQQAVEAAAQEEPDEGLAEAAAASAAAVPAVAVAEATPEAAAAAGANEEVPTWAALAEAGAGVPGGSSSGNPGRSS